VCSALDHSIKAKVAIKKVPKAFEDLIDAKRIVREIKLLSKLRNHLLRIL
jgi:mitogen-activated protein kinase 1/3